MIADGFQFIRSFRALTTDHYWFDLDEYRRGQDSLLLAHLRFDRFSPSIMKNVQQQWSAFRACVTAPVFALGEVDDEKWERFVSLLGFRYCTQVTCANGQSRRLFTHIVQPCCKLSKDGNASYYGQTTGQVGEHDFQRDGEQPSV